MSLTASVVTASRPHPNELSWIRSRLSFVLTKLAAPSKTAYRYLRYLSPNNGNCNVAEVQFYGVKTRTETSGIHEITSAHKNVVYYNLQGMRVDNPVEGALYVTSQGRKVIYRSGNTGF